MPLRTVLTCIYENFTDPSESKCFQWAAPVYFRGSLLCRVLVTLIIFWLSACLSSRIQLARVSVSCQFNASLCSITCTTRCLHRCIAATVPNPWRLSLVVQQFVLQCYTELRGKHVLPSSASAAIVHPFSDVPAAAPLPPFDNSDALRRNDDIICTSKAQMHFIFMTMFPSVSLCTYRPVPPNGNIDFNQTI